MAYNFPLSPAAGTLYAPAGGPSWRFLDGAWQQELPALPVYASNAAALAGGLVVGSYYRTGADPDHVCVVH
jgi:hypothetical protein